MADTAWKVGVYTRLSREDGDKSESESIGNQKEIIRAFIREHKDMALVQEYVDDGYSGVNFDRPAFKQMMEDVKEQRINCIICKDLSRFARNYIDAGRYLEKILPFMGVRFIAINDNYDSRGERTEADSLIVPFKNLINDAYCKDISMKIRSQLEIKRKMGEFIGAFTPFGYKREKDPENKNRLVVDEPAAQVVELIYRLRLQGMSNTRIANKLNEMGVLSPMAYKCANGLNYESGFRINENAMWTPVSIVRILTNEVYLGTLIQHKRGTPNYKVKKEIQYPREDWVIIEKNHPAIIEQVDFDTVQSLMRRDARVPPDEEAVHLYSGYIHCGDCQHTMVRKMVPSRGRKYYYYVCSTHKAGLGCHSHSFSEAKLTKIVLSLIQDHIQQVCRVDEVLAYIAELPENQREVIDYDDQIVKINAEIERIQELKMSLYSGMKDGILNREEYMEFRAGYDRKIKAKQRALLQLEENRRLTVDHHKKNETWIELFKRFENITELRRSVIVNLLERIIIYDSKHIEIVFRYQDKLDHAVAYIERFTSILEEGA